MSLNMKNLDKAAKLLAEYKEVEQEIKKVDKIALLAAERKTTSCFTLLVTDDEKADALDDKIKKKIAGGPKHISEFIEGIFERLEKGEGPLEDDTDYPQEKIHIHLGNMNLLEILGIVLRDRKEKKAELRKQITELGINLD